MSKETRKAEIYIYIYMKTTYIYIYEKLILRQISCLILVVELFLNH